MGSTVPCKVTVMSSDVDLDSPSTPFNSSFDWVSEPDGVDASTPIGRIVDVGTGGSCGGKEYGKVEHNTGGYTSTEFHLWHSLLSATDFFLDDRHAVRRSRF